MAYLTNYRSSIGVLSLVGDADALVGLWINQEKFLQNKYQEKADLPIFVHAKRWLDEYFEGKNPLISELNLAPVGSMFQQKVWAILKNIPFGQVVTYGDIAREIACQTGKQKISAQAVGGAVGRNPISIIIPCHRVIGKNDKLVGYGGGLDIKVKLLQHEGIDTSRLKYPKHGRFA